MYVTIPMGNVQHSRSASHAKLNESWAGGKQAWCVGDVTCPIPHSNDCISKVR